MNTAVLDDDEAEQTLCAGHTTSGVHPRHLLCGNQIAGRYAVLGVLGRGGFAVVYDAEHVGLKRRVAIKVLELSGETETALIERFRREARISALVRHPNVLEVFDTGTLEDGSPFLVMERIVGETLFERMAHTTLTVSAVVEIARQLLTALAVLAESGIVHRDIKPENLMLHDSGNGRLLVKVVDFGISKRVVPQLDTRLTSSGALVGTPNYMSPEQLRGEEVDPRTDLYSAGVVLYEALTGHVPYERPSFTELVLAALHDTLRPVRQLRASCPVQLERIVLKALSRKREDRYDSAAAMLDDLECFAQSHRLPRGPAAFRAVEPIEPPHGFCRSLTTSWVELRAGALRLWSSTCARVPPHALKLAMLAAAVAVQGGATQHTWTSPTPALTGSAPQAVSGLASLALRPEVSILQPRGLAPAGTPQRGPSSAPAPRGGPPHEPPAAREQAPDETGVLARPRDDEHRSSRGSRNAQRARTPRSRPTRAPSANTEARPQSESPVLAVQASDAGLATQVLQQASALSQQGRYAEAEQLYRKAVQLSPREPAAWLGLGLVSTQRGHHGEARRALLRYLELDPQAHEAHAIRARLKALP